MNPLEHWLVCNRHRGTASFYIENIYVKNVLGSLLLFCGTLFSSFSTQSLIKCMPDWQAWWTELLFFSALSLWSTFKVLVHFDRHLCSERIRLTHNPCWAWVVWLRVSVSNSPGCTIPYLGRHRMALVRTVWADSPGRLSRCWGVGCVCCFFTLVLGFWMLLVFWGALVYFCNVSALLNMFYTMLCIVASS